MKEILAKTSSELLGRFPRNFGGCTYLSAFYYMDLINRGIKANLVAGDLSLNGKKVFQLKEFFPEFKFLESKIDDAWEGHCWVEVNDFICEMSLIRSANLCDKNHVLYKFTDQISMDSGTIVMSKDDSVKLGLRYETKQQLSYAQAVSIIKGYVAICGQPKGMNIIFD